MRLLGTLLVLSILYGCSNEPISTKCSNEFLILEGGSSFDIQCFKLTTDSQANSIVFSYLLDTEKKIFNVNFRENKASYNNNGSLEPLVYRKEYLLILNSKGYLVKQFVSNRNKKDGESEFYFLEHFGLIYMQSTTWFSSMKLHRLENQEKNSVIPAILEILQMKDCSEEVDFALRYQNERDS